MPNLRVLRHVLRLSCTEAPSLRRSYPVSAVLRTSPPPQSFLPIHVYDTEKSRPVAVILRPGKTPSGVEVRAHLRRLVRRIRARWPMTRILFRGDGHYARPEAMTRRLRVRPSRHEAALQESRRDGRRRADRARNRRQGRRARLRRDAPQSRLLGQGAARHRPHRGDAARGSTSASSSLTSTAVHPNGSTRPSTALAARRKISSSCTRLSSPPTARRAARRSPIRFASSSTPPPTG